MKLKTKLNKKNNIGLAKILFEFSIRCWKDLKIRQIFEVWKIGLEKRQAKISVKKH